MSIDLHPIPAFSDNYIWMLSNPVSRQAWVVDPGEAAPVLEALSERGLTLAGILVTHHHWDHVAGIAELLKTHPVPVYGPAGSPAADSISVPLEDGGSVCLEDSKWMVFTVPGHTLDHIAYYNADAGILFCGDTLFSGGCGRLFEGTAEQMFVSLQRLAALPDTTRVCCAHEYTLSNLRFALAVEPDNAVLARYQQQCLQLRDSGCPTLPSSIGLEKEVNPFLRAVDVSTFAHRRAWKDTF